MVSVLRRLEDRRQYRPVGVTSTLPGNVAILPVGYVITLTEQERREVVDALRHWSAIACEDCGEPTCDDPSPCTHRPICNACWPAHCQQCQAEVEDDREWVRP